MAGGCPGPLHLPLGSLLGGEGRSWELCEAWHRLQEQGRSCGCCQAVTAQPRWELWDAELH